MKFGTLAGGLDCFPLAYGRYHPYTDSRVYFPGIRSLIKFSTSIRRHRLFSALPPRSFTTRLGVNLFRGEPAISEFDWNFSASHKSSVRVSGHIGSVLHNVLPLLQPAQG